MTDLDQILPLWSELEGCGAEYVLATVVSVEGSSYRKPGARMLLAGDGQRAGTVSGGCLEAAVAKRAWWLTENGPVVRPYSTLEDDGELPYGSGCGGVVHILLERRETAAPLLHALKTAFDARVPLAIATVIEGVQTGQRAIAGLPGTRGQSFAPIAACVPGAAETLEFKLGDLAEAALGQRTGSEVSVEAKRVWVDYRPARPGLWVFGAGDDAKPLVKLARTLGWFVAVADGRSNLTTASRFPEADVVRVLPIRELPSHELPIQELPAATAECFALHAGDAAVVMTHSFEQDARILAALLARPPRPAYIGVLGPQRRTRELLAEAARLLDLTPSVRLVESWLEELHAPVGLDLGADAPATIALSIVAEIQKAITAATALPLRQVRGSRAETRV
jgi:xanthine dehydrogenase accessory factor